MITRNTYTQGKGELEWDTWPIRLVHKLSLQSENETNDPLKSGPALAGPAGPATPPLSWLNKCIHAQTWTAINWMQYFASRVATTALLLSQNGLRSNLRASNFKKFSGGACPQTPLLLHSCACVLIIRCPCNPPSKNPGYGPDMYVWECEEECKMRIHTPNYYTRHGFTYFTHN